MWAWAAHRLRGAAAPSRVSTVAAPVGCLQPTGLAQDLVALASACCSAASKKRTFKDCASTRQYSGVCCGQAILETRRILESRASTSRHADRILCYRLTGGRGA